MNRLTLMQTHPSVPIPFFNSTICIDAANTARRNPIQSPIDTAAEITDQHRADSLALTCTSNLSLVPISASTECLMLVTVRADSVTDLRHLIMRTCSDMIVFIKTQPTAHATKMKVWVCLSESVTDRVMDAVMHTLPSAEFGPVTFN